MASQTLAAATSTSDYVLPKRCSYHPCIFLLLLLAPFIAQADHAYVDSDRVHLPVVDDYPHPRSLELLILHGTFPLEFVVAHTGDADGPVRLSSAWYDGNRLIIPEVWINDVSYWAELRELAGDRFILEVVLPNPVSNLSGGSTYHHQDWEYMQGEARDIGIGADGSVWAAGEDYYGDGYGLYRWDGRQWWESYGAAIRVDVDPWGSPWVINAEHEIFRLVRGRWEYIPGAASDIGIGADGSVWVVGVDDRRGGSSIYTLGNFGWMKVQGTGVRIDVDGAGTPWVVNDDDQIFRRENGLWRRVPGRARDIGIGADGSVWVIGVDDHPDGHSIYRFNGTGWDKVPGKGSQISVGPDGEPWVVNRNGDIFRSWGTYY